MMIKKYQTLVVLGLQLLTKISEFESKIPVVSDLVKKTEYDAKILKNERKYFNSFDYKVLQSLKDYNSQQIRYLQSHKKILI